MAKNELITDDQSFDGAIYGRGDYEILTYDDGYGPLWISRGSIGINGIVRARTWEDAYSICEDEFFPEADETIEEIVKEYGFKREHFKIIKTNTLTNGETRHPQLGQQEKFAVYPDDYTDNGKLPEGSFIRWETIETPDPEGWMDNELFQEGFGFRPNGPNKRDKLNHGIYAKDLNGDSLDLLTAEMVEDLGITLHIGNPSE